MQYAVCVSSKTRHSCGNWPLILILWHRTTVLLKILYEFYWRSYDSHGNAGVQRELEDCFQKSTPENTDSKMHIYSLKDEITACWNVLHTLTKRRSVPLPKCSLKLITYLLIPQIRSEVTWSCSVGQIHIWQTDSTISTLLTGIRHCHRPRSLDIRARVQKYNEQTAETVDIDT